MTPEEYIIAVQELAQRREYASLIEFAERVGPEVEDRLTAKQVRILKDHLKHADVLTSTAQARPGSA